MVSRKELLRAATLDVAIDEIFAGRTAGDLAEAFGAAEASRLAAAFAAVPASPARADIRRRVLSSALDIRPRRALKRWLVLVPSTVLLLGGGIAVAARNAAPGDALFKVRRALAAARVAVAYGDHAKAVALLDRAAGSLADARRLGSSGEIDRANDALKVFRRDIANARAEIVRLAPSERPSLLKRAAALQAEAAEVRTALGSLKPDGAGADAALVPPGGPVAGDPSDAKDPSEATDPSESTDPSEEYKDPSGKPEDPSKKERDPSDKPTDPTPGADASGKPDPNDGASHQKEKPQGEEPSPHGSGHRPDDPGSPGDAHHGGNKKDRPAE